MVLFRGINSKKAGDSEEQLGSTFQGFHSDHVMVVFDESVGVPSDVWKMASGLLTSGKAWIVTGKP